MKRPGREFEAFAAKGVRASTAPKGGGRRILMAAAAVGIAIAAVRSGVVRTGELLLADHHVRGDAADTAAPRP